MIQLFQMNFNNYFLNMKFLSYINNFLTKNRKNIIYIVSIVFIFFYFADLSFAEWPTATTPQTWSSDKNWVIELINWFLKIAAAILWLLTFLVGLFLYPEWTSWSIIWLWWNDWGLKQMWIMISNIVYFVFALIFLWIAFMNVIWKEWDYSLKEALPRFIVWLLIVPFTWFFVQFILSISAILTVWVLSLPYDTFKDTYMKKDDLNKIELCKDYEINVWKQKKDEMPVKCKEWWEKIKLSDILSWKNSDSLYWITAVYTYAIMAVDGNWKLSIKDIWSWISDLVSLWVKWIFDLIFVLVYALLMIALALALFVRWVYLWFYAMWSPLFWLLYFFKKEKEWIWGWKFSLTEFISLAMVPVYVSAALAFWLLFIFSAWNAMKDSKTVAQSWWKPIIEDWGKKINFWWFSYTLSWAVNDWWNKEQVKKLIWWFQWTFWTLILQVFWLAILWMAVMAAINESKITQTVADPFTQFWKSIWDLAMKAPTYAPILPGGLSAHWLAQVWSMPEQAIQNKSSAIAWQFREPIEWVFGWKIIDPKILRKMDTLMDDKNWIQKEELQELMKLQADLVRQYWRNNPVVKGMEQKIAKILWENKWTLNQADIWQADFNKLKNWDEREFAKALLWWLSWKTPDEAEITKYLNARNPNNNFDWNQPQSQTPTQTKLPTWISKVDDSKNPNKYNVWGTEINITNNWSWLDSWEITKIAEKLKDVSKDKWTSWVESVLAEMKITDKKIIDDIQKKIDDLNKKP